ncbi:hypothetical protein BDQ12DRAFT_570871, partial [Crucibulum laeve]
LIDDGISPSAEDIICGVYKRPTGNGQQTADYSWWPKATIWENRGMNFGYWTTDCEKWFQKRLGDIQCGTATPRTAKEWTNILK